MTFCSWSITEADNSELFMSTSLNESRHNEDSNSDDSRCQNQTNGASFDQGSFAPPERGRAMDLWARAHTPSPISNLHLHLHVSKLMTVSIATQEP